MLGEDPLGALANGAGPAGAGGGPGNQMQAQQSSQEQEVVQQNTKPATAPSRYESQKRRDWNTFGQYLKNHRPPLALARCSGTHVLDFLRYLDQFGKTKVHLPSCHFFGLPNPPHPCPCPLRQAWGSLDALIGRLRAAFEENGGKPESNPFGARVVRLYLREVREMQAKARGIAYEKKKRKRPQPSGASASSNEQLQALPQGSAQANPLTGHGYAHSQQHTQHAQHTQHPQHPQHPHHAHQHPHHAQQQHPHHSSQHSPHGRHSQHTQHSQHSPHAPHTQQQQQQQQSHHSHGSPVSHPHSAYPPSTNPLSPFSQQQQHAQQQQQAHAANLLHNYAPTNSGTNAPLNPYTQPNTLNGYQELQLHNHTAGPLLS